ADTERAMRPAQTADLEQCADLILRSALEHRRLRLEAELLARPAQRSLEDLTDVHAARHAERIQHDVDRRSIRQERQVLLRHDAGDDALVALPAGHLVTYADLALLRGVALLELNDTCRPPVRLPHHFGLHLVH